IHTNTKQINLTLNLPSRNTKPITAWISATIFSNNCLLFYSKVKNTSSFAQINAPQIKVIT
uniref:hypothetical protein n=1 Tax=Chryseobacterium sp. TaxID=1871047 RepID=UPI0028A181BC